MNKNFSRGFLYPWFLAKKQKLRGYVEEPIGKVKITAQFSGALLKSN